MTATADPQPAAVQLRIGELALHGVPVPAAGLGPALAAALERVLRERGVPAAWSAGAAPQPRPVTVLASADPELLARRLAVALYEGLTG